MFDCDLSGVIYLIICKKCSKIYVGSTTTSFRIRFNNNKGSAKRYGTGQRGMPGEHLYAYFHKASNEGIEDMAANIIQRRDVKDPKRRNFFCSYN